MKKTFKKTSDKEELEKGERLAEHRYCIADELLEQAIDEIPEVKKLKPCGSSDALSLYEHDHDGEVCYSGYCWSCGQPFSPKMVAASSLAEDLGVDSTGKTKTPKNHTKKIKAKPLTSAQRKKLIATTGYVSHGYRGIKDEYNRFFGHLTRLENNKVVARYYPETIDNKVVGYKCRNHPKDFTYGKLGQTGTSCQLSGQIKWPKGSGKYVLVTGGEEDKVAAYQMFSEYQKRTNKTGFEPPHVVSPTAGEGAVHKQLAAQYEWLDTHDFIVLGLDADKAGKEAIARCCEVLPEDKLLIVNWSGKDPNKMLQDGKEAQFLSDFYSAKEYISSGIKSSIEALDDIEELLVKPRLTLPPHMKSVQENMRGGIIWNRVVNVIGDTSSGKSTHINDMVYHWIMNEPDAIVGVVSLEATSAEYAMDLLSIHLEENLMSMPNGKDILDHINTDEVREARDELFMLPNGEPRFYIVDEREGKIQVVERQIERMIKQYGCNVIIIDVLSDLLRSLDNKEQDRHMSWQKRIVKGNVIIVNALHTRKALASGDVGGYRKVTEYDALGSSSFVQSAHINIVINRDKNAQDSYSRNTTEFDMPKCRGGITGHAGKSYYDYNTRKSHDFNEFFKDKDPTEQVEPEEKPKKKSFKPKNEEKDNDVGNVEDDNVIENDSNENDGELDDPPWDFDDEGEEL